MVDLIEKKNKKQRVEGVSHSLTLSNLGPMASLYICDEDVKEWHAMNLEEATRSIKDSTQLQYHLMNIIDKHMEEKALLTRLEGKNSSLLIKLMENDRKWQKELRSKDASLSFLNKEIQDQEEMLKTLNDKFNTQEHELSSLKERPKYLENEQKNGWPDEKQKIEDEKFEKCFNFYLTGFLTNDPEYTFEKFGEESKAEIEQFKIDNAKLIRERRVELGKEVNEGAPSGDEFDTAGKIEGAPPSIQPTILEAPSDGASAAPL